MSSADRITKFHQYHRGAGNSRRGVIAAEYNHATRSFKVAHSLCSLSDNLDPRVGVMIAKGRLHDMEWIPMDRFDHFDGNNVIPWSMRATLVSVLDRIDDINDKSINAVQYPNTPFEVRMGEGEPSIESQLDQIITQGVADAREAIRQGVCGGQCGCCG